MRTINTLALSLLAMASLSCSSSHSEEWKLVWEDEFNQTDGFDTSVWSKIPRGRSDWSNYMSDFDSLYSVENGNLILRGVVNHTQTDDKAEFLTGGIYTKDKLTFENGRVEIRAKLESSTGGWPAFWLLPIEGRWPMNGEIDIMEHLNHDDFVYQTVHTNYTFNLNIKDPANSATSPINKDDYNTYAVEMYQDSIRFFVNDIKTLTYPRINTEEAAKDGQFPFADQPFYLLLDMQLGGSWVGGVDAKELPIAMYIDWVRFYQKEE